MISTVKALQAYINKGKMVDYLFFWGHHRMRNLPTSPCLTEKSSNCISKSCLSNWYPATFILHEIKYATTEQYIMAQKAMLFKDEDIYHMILKVKTPKEAKSLGRHVRGFNENIWKAYRIDIMVTGNEAKFSQNVSLKQYLLSTGEKILVEASPYDIIWGIGMSVDNPNSTNPEAWKGSNLLGFALMEVRSRLQRK